MRKEKAHCWFIYMAQSKTAATILFKSFIALWGSIWMGSLYMYRIDVAIELVGAYLCKFGDFFLLSDMLQSLLFYNV